MKKLILHIDDEAEIRGLLAEYLARRDFRVVSVATPTEAFKAIREEPPALIITDLQLEEEDGLAMVEKLKALLPDTPVILLTGVLIDPAVAAATVERKVAAYLEKTAPLSKLLEEVRRLTA